MARPRNADAKRTRQLILDAAVVRFGNQGLAGTSLRLIAADVSLSFATIHHYFGSKQGLYEAAVESGFEQLRGLETEMLTELGRSQDTPPIPAELIDRGARCAFRFASKHALHSRFLLRATVFELDAPNRSRFEQSQRDYLDQSSEALGALLGRKPADLRVPLQGLMFLLTRMAVTSEIELKVIGGSPTKARADLEDYVARVAVATLTVPV